VAERVPALGLDPGDVAHLSPECLPGLLAALAALQGAVAARLVAPALVRSDGRSVGNDCLLSATEAAKRTGMSTRWLWKHADTLPFARRIGRAVRFSPAGIEKWLATRKSLRQA
jgi:predicted DNA-binding transcriptional regulator AlpA